MNKKFELQRFAVIENTTVTGDLEPGGRRRGYQPN